MHENDIFKMSKFAISFVLWLSKRITSGGPRYRETCQLSLDWPPTQVCRVILGPICCENCLKGMNAEQE